MRIRLPGGVSIQASVSAILAAALCVLIAEVCPIEVQSLGGTIAGTVTDRSGAVLSDATVEMTGGGRALTFSTRGDGSTAF